MNICVFCASSRELPDLFYREAEKLGTMIAGERWRLVYGGTKQGLMEALATGALSGGGEIIGVIPRCIVEMGIADRRIATLKIARDMKERKEIMRKHADAFVALPGGWGTLEEISEVITLKQLGQHSKPVVFINTGNFYDAFFHFIAEAREKQFVPSKYDGLYHVVSCAEDALRYIKTDKGQPVEAKY